MKADENMLDGRMLIDGEMTVGDGGASGQWIESHDPATLEPTGRVPAATATDVDRAVRVAAQAQLAWAKKSVWERAAVLRGLAAAIRARGAEILALEARTRSGKGCLVAIIGISLAALSVFPTDTTWADPVFLVHV